MIPQDVMAWVAGWFPLASFVAGALVYGLCKRVWPATVFVLAGTLAALYFRFSMHFWPWLLLYLMLCWLGSWAVWQWQEWRQRRTAEVSRASFRHHDGNQSGSTQTSTS